MIMVNTGNSQLWSKLSNTSCILQLLLAAPPPPLGNYVNAKTRQVCTVNANCHPLRISYVVPGQM